MITKTSAEFVPLTHELATKISTMNPVPGERDKKPGRLNFFRRCLKRKRFNSPTWAVAKVRDTEEELRVDGQHTSSILAELPPDQFPQGLQVTINHFQIDSVEEDAEELFDMFDNPQSTRSNTDMMSVFRAKHEEIRHLENAFLVKVATGIDYYLEGTPASDEKPVPRYMRRQFGGYWSDPQNRAFALWLHPWETSRHGWMISKGELVAEIYHDWTAFPELATDFWGHVFLANHPDPGDETRELSNALMDMMASKRKIKRNAFRRQARKAFDRWRRLALADQRESQIPFRVLSSEPPEASVSA